MLQIALYGLVAQFPKADVKGLADQLIAVGGAVEQAQRGGKTYGAAAAALQLCHRCGMGAGLADTLTVQQQNLVRTDDQVLRVAFGQCPGLVQRQSLGQLFGAFIGSGGFIDIRRGADERQPEALQQGAAIGRAGGKQQVGHGAVLWSGHGLILSCPEQYGTGVAEISK